ncbi:putative pentatricopeptide repeat-containing protein [Drosera capensis]
MPGKNEVSWTSMIVLYLELERLGDARRVFDEMIKEGEMGLGWELFDNMPEKDMVSYTAMADGYAKSGDMVFTRHLFEQCEKKDVFLWSALISGYAQNGLPKAAVNMFLAMQQRSVRPDQHILAHGQGSKAVSLFYQMLGEGITHDDVAFMVILNACSRQGLVEDGFRLFELMRSQSSIVPSHDHYACMVDLFGRSGLLRPAFNLIKSIPVEAHVGAWVALLGACKLHCATELGEEVAARLAQLEPQNAGNYVLLSNIYAAANRWMDVTALRNQIDAQGLEVIAGRSYT